MSAMARFAREGYLWRVRSHTSEPVPYDVAEYLRLDRRIRDASMWFASEAAAVKWINERRRAN